MSSNVYRNLGRGGAGNYYSKTDMEDVAKRIPQDLEAQNSPREAAADDTPATQEYSHLGRGGAGNVALSALMEKGTSSSSQPTMKSSQPNPMSGRGGAGNYRAEQKTLENERAEEEAEEARRRVQDEVKLDVEKGLMPPQKAYIGQ
ncbi:hypothetical protein FGG08_002754 [Glutinoglossum americanum]|uniref:Uncharacterized protein n=1 Tax=Glutinoglossum americanum TaxID=1670608 RepID=A0A9P8I5P9_9PEZI|nr:hypothetical protein FGG08_002754 [Glutinoglossum americanum]